MGPEATPDQTDHVVARLEEAGVDARVSRGREATVIGAIGDRELLATLPVEGYPGVEQVVPIVKPYRLVARELAADPTVIEVDGRRIGDTYFGLIAGPCTVETREQTLETARAVAAFRVLDDPEGVDASLVARRIGIAQRVDLRERTERALVPDADLVPALDDGLDPPFDGQVGMEGVLELTRAGRKQLDAESDAWARLASLKA